MAHRQRPRRFGQSALQSALENFFSGAGELVAGIPGQKQENRLIAQKASQTAFERSLREAAAGRAERGLELQEEGVRERRTDRQRNFLLKNLEATVARSEEQQQQAALSRLLGQSGITGSRAQDFLTAGVKPSFGQLLPEPDKPAKTPLERLTPQQRISLTSTAVEQQRSDILDQLQAGLEGRDVSFSRDEFGRASQADLGKQARIFADPGGDRPGIFGSEQPQDTSFLALFNRAQSILSDTARARTSQNLPQFFPSLRTPGRSRQRQIPRTSTGEIDVKNLSREDLEKLARGEEL